MQEIQFDEQFIDSSLKEEMASIEAKACAALDDLRKTPNPLSGWFNFPQNEGFELVENLEKFKASLTIDYDMVLVIGIGGSYLGCRAIAEALNHTQIGLVSPLTSGDRPLLKYAGHHLSELELIEILDLMGQKSPLVNVISKSGTTTEPSVAFRIIRDTLERRFGIEEARERIIVTTDVHSGALKELADEKRYQKFVVPENMGGRYSVLSAVGALPLILAGFDVSAIMSGADSFFKNVRTEDISALKDQPIIRYPLFRNAAYAQGKRTEIFAYSEPRLLYIAEWWKQLFGESEGKVGKGLFPASVCYTTDLHSLGQFAQEGTRNLIETFLVFGKVSGSYKPHQEMRLRVPTLERDEDGLNYLAGCYIDEINQAAIKATRLAHFEGSLPNVELRMPRLDANALGYLLAFYKTSCAVSARILGVDPFDQPGVEAYKINLFALLGKSGYESRREELRGRIL